jgi:hypothetical protein
VEKSLGKSGSRCKDGIKMDLKGIDFEDDRWLDIA